MNQNHEIYSNPLVTRYASNKMSVLWSERRKTNIWRKLWVALAEAEHELGLPVSSSQINELKSHIDDIDFDLIAKYEQQFKHDVMAHIHAYSAVCPKAAPIIHLGATSCFVTDNADLLLLHIALTIIAEQLAKTINTLKNFIQKYRDLPCLGYTHLQPAQLTTVGKRACLWAYDLTIDLTEVETRIKHMLARSIKGATGTQASFLKLFNGDHDKVLQLESIVANKMGFDNAYPVTGQTYPRKIDSQIISTLSGIAQSTHKAATDIRLLINQKEMDEPFEQNQIGSSAMAYKRNPIHAERICSLSRYVMSLPANTAMTAATQWMERTLDDSANRRIVLPQAFLATDAILTLYQNIMSNIVVYPTMIDQNIQTELPFIAAENILMIAAAAGGDRQKLHEQIRKHSQKTIMTMKQNNTKNDLMKRLADDKMFSCIDFNSILDKELYVGRAPQQTDEFKSKILDPICIKYRLNNMES